MRNDQRQRGLTLLELVVVLAILAALGTVMVTQTTNLTSEARYEQTARTLEQLDAAVVGETGLRGPDGQRLIAGFVADIGRLPDSLDELWEIGSLNAFAIDKSPAGDPTLAVAGGWRGPYLRLPVGADDLTDGWGRPFETLDEDGNTITSGPIKILRSRGPDNVVGGVGYDRDLYVVFEASSTATGLDGVDSAVPARHEGDVQVARVERADGSDPVIGDGQYVVIRVYGPDPNTGDVRTIEQMIHDLGPGGDGPVVENKTLSNVPIGPRVIRAYQVSTSPATDEEDLSSADPISDPVYFVNLAGGPPSIELVLEAP
jgi:prepilin-type N-terminal cleavage/methylation domain-containing protein